MSGANWLQLLVLVAAVLATTPLLGAYLATRPRRRRRAAATASSFRSSG